MRLVLFFPSSRLLFQAAAQLLGIWERSFCTHRKLHLHSTSCWGSDSLYTLFIHLGLFWMLMLNLEKPTLLPTAKPGLCPVLLPAVSPALQLLAGRIYFQPQPSSWHLSF